MSQPDNIQKHEFEESLWKALQVFNVNRLLLTTALLFMQQLGISPKFFGTVHPTLYQWTISLYFLFAVVVILLLKKRIPDYKASVILQLSFDILAIITIIHASGGPNNGLGVLLAVSVGVSSLLIGNMKALAVPAMATLALFAETLFANYHDFHVLDFTQSGILGASFFIISLLSFHLAKRLHYTEMVAIESQTDLANMEAISDNIIQTMTVGVLIIDQDDQVRLINDSAWKNLGMPPNPQNKPLQYVSRELYQELTKWLENTDSISYKPETIQSGHDTPELQIHFKQLGDYEQKFIMIFLEDTSLLNQKAKQLKLSSLGRLTASIAHEIRNPLGAISHAAQLLQESESIGANDKDLCDMITKHSHRVNGIIENVMNLSQRKVPHKESIPLKPLIELCLDELSLQKSIKPSITLDISPPESFVLFDRSQLLQILTNLCDNGLRYSKEQTGIASLTLTGGDVYGSAAQYLDIIDKGPGIPESERDNLFEPFYTTSEQGTGLGLYLARQLCEANGARLNYIPIPNSTGSCFRINFARHRENN